MPVVTLKASYAMIAAIDAMRGEGMSRERWLHQAVRQVIRDGLRTGKPSERDDEEDEE